MSRTTVGAPHRVVMRVTAPLIHLCPYRDEVDEGTVSITWETEGRTFELHSLREWLVQFKNQKVSHEELTKHIKDELDFCHGLTVVSVATHWGTAGMDVGCSI